MWHTNSYTYIHWGETDMCLDLFKTQGQLINNIPGGFEDTAHHIFRGALRNVITQ